MQVGMQYGCRVEGRGGIGREGGREGGRINAAVPLAVRTAVPGDVLLLYWSNRFASNLNHSAPSVLSPYSFNPSTLRPPQSLNPSIPQSLNPSRPLHAHGPASRCSGGSSSREIHRRPHRNSHRSPHCGHRGHHGPQPAACSPTLSSKRPAAPPFHPRDWLPRLGSRNRSRDDCPLSP